MSVWFLSYSYTLNERLYLVSRIRVRYMHVSKRFCTNFNWKCGLNCHRLAAASLLQAISQSVSGSRNAFELRNHWNSLCAPLLLHFITAIAVCGRGMSEWSDADGVVLIITTILSVACASVSVFVAHCLKYFYRFCFHSESGMWIAFAAGRVRGAANTIRIIFYIQ